MKGIRRIQYNSPVILTYALLSLAALVLGYFTKDQSTFLLFSVYRSSLQDVLFYFRLFGHVLGHANLEHYGNNFLLILIIGPILEEKYGSRTLLILILATAGLTGILHMLLSPNILLGASGVVFMLILLSSYVNLQKGRIPITLILVVIIFLGREVFEGLHSTDNISRVTHVIGGACGAGLGFLLNRRHLKEDAMKKDKAKNEDEEGPTPVV